MARSYARFMPAGYESDADEDYNDDGYGISTESHPREPAADPVGSQEEATPPVEEESSGGRGGFGLPQRHPKHKKSQWPEKQKSLHTSRFMANGQEQVVTLEDFKTVIIRGNQEEVKQYLNKGLNIDEVLRSGWTALMYAGNYANVDSLRQLLEHGANPNFHADQYTVLMATCASKKDDEHAILQCVEDLVKHKADINAFDRFHMTPLMFSAREGRAMTTKFLLENGASIDNQDNRGYSSLGLAACKGHVRVVRVLLEAGADVYKVCCDGSTPIDMAYANDYEKIAGLMEKYTNGERQGAITELSTLVTTETKQREPEEAGPRTVKRYGELELFLMGVEMNHLIPKFQENEITFETFLRFTDHDLQQMGISQLGARKKLLDSIRETHKKEWQPASLPSVQYNKPISCSEAIAMVANMSKHTAYMGSTAGYVADQIRLKPDILQNAKEGATVEDLVARTDEAMGKVRVIYKELTDLRTFLAKEMSLEDFRAPDLISYKEPVKRSQPGHTRTCLTILASVTAVSVILWKRDLITNVLDTISRPLIDRCSMLLPH